MFHRNEEDLVKDVVNLRNQLRQTEFSLQSLGEQLSGSGSNSDRSDHSPGRVQPGGLTLEDLHRPDLTQPPPISPILAETSLRIATCNVPHTDYRPSSITEVENSELRRKLGSIREENSCLVLENQKLVNELEAVQFELASSHAKVMGTTADPKSPSLSVMKEHIQGLEAEVEARGTALRASEQKVEERQQCVLTNSRMVTKLKQELKTVQADLAHRISQGKRMEQQRNEALRNAEKLTMAFKEYKGNISEKMAKVMENEVKLKGSLIECDREREELEARCSKLERERAETSRMIWQLKEASAKAEALSGENADLRSRAESSSSAVGRLQRELADCVVAAEALKRENGELRSFSTSQEQRLALCLREGEQTRAELASLEAILNVLHLREGGGALCVQPCILPQVSLSGYSDFRNAKPGERYAQLLPVLQALEQERSRQAGLASALQEQLSRAQEELSALQSSTSQRTSHFQRIHSELLEKAGEATRLERELRKKTARVGALEKQLQEKAAAYSAAAVKNCELEQILLDKSSSLQHTESLLSRKQKDSQQALEKAKKANAEKCKQLQDQMGQLQQSLDQKKAQVLELEKRLSLAQRERKEAQHKSEQLQTTLAQVTQEKELNAIQNEGAVRSLKEQAAGSAASVKDLEAALMSCRDELSTYLLKIEETQTLFEKQLELKSAEVETLQVELKNSAQASKASSKYLAQLQFSLQQQEAMLQESSARVSELEESQALQQRRVSQLEKELEVERTRATEELRMREQRERDAGQEVQKKEREMVKLTSSLQQLTAEMSQCQGKLTETELELLRLRRDSSSKASQLSQMKESLEETQGLLEKKSEMVVDLEEQLHRSEMDRRNSLQRAQLLESQLQTVRGELAGTLDHLQELRSLLQRTQLTVEERDAAIEKLAEELRESRRELEERSHEVLDLDATLKERQEELQKRAQQLSKLDVAIQDHKLEQERKILHLQRALERSEQEVQERQKQVDFLSERLEMVRSQLTAKESLEKDALDQGQQLRLCREQLQRAAQEQRDLRSRCEGLARELEGSTQLARDREARAKQLAQELADMEAQAMQREAKLQVSVASLQEEVEHLKEEHRMEVSSLQQSRAQLLKISEHSRSSQELRAGQLAEKLQRVQAQLGEVQERANCLQEELHLRERELHTASEALLIKESEVTRLQAKISSYDRKAELQNASLLNESSACKSPTPPPGNQEARFAADFPDWADDESLDLPQSVKDCLQVALRPLEQSWQGLSQLDTSSSELSFNPLTYAAGEDTVLASPGPQPQDHTFTSMLKLLSRTASAEDSAPSWTSSSKALSSTERPKDSKEAHCSSPEDV